MGLRRAIFVLAIGVVIRGPAVAAVVEYRLSRWSPEIGGDGRLYAVLIADEPWSWREARDAASASGGRLAAAASPHELSFLVSIASGPGVFDCAGPWIGGFRSGGGTWAWLDGSIIPSFGWEPGRPAQASELEAALCLAGEGAPSGTWFDALPGTDTGIVSRSALVIWDDPVDCDGDGVPDKLEILLDATLDGDANGAIDGCGTPNPADLNGDGRVTGADLGLLLASFNTPGPVGDLNRDGTVNGADLGLLLAAWTG